MKKILGLSITALLLIGLVAGGTFAYFSDTETSSNNLITAGTLDLKINTLDANVNIISALTNKQPGDADKAPGPYATLSNSGSLSGNLTIAFGIVTNTESTGSTEYEKKGTGELGHYIKIAPWIDLDGDGVLETDDILLKSDGTHIHWVSEALQWDYIDHFGNVSFATIIDPFAGTNPGPAASVRFYLPWDFIETGGDQNSAQGDSVSFGITFTLDQT